MIGLAIIALFVVQSGDWTPYDEADARLTGAYEVLRSHLTPTAATQLRDGERQWILQRNKACGFEARNACATRLTNRRVTELEAGIVRQRNFTSIPDQQLLTLEAKVDDACRGSGQDADGVVCQRRDEIVAQLQSRGWCWGPDNAPGEYARRWMRAGRACRLQIRQ